MSALYDRERKDTPSFSSPSLLVAKGRSLEAPAFCISMVSYNRGMDTEKKRTAAFQQGPRSGKGQDADSRRSRTGFLTPRVASALYHCMLFDVTECCCDALRDLECADAERHALESTCEYQPLRDTYTLFISSPGIEQEEKMRALFAESGTWPRNIVFIHDDGESFDAHYNSAFDQVWDLGYETILSMGCDMPALDANIIIEGFERLHELCDRPGGGIVLAPDQEMGVSVVGWTRETNFDHTGVFYNADGLTVLPAYIQKARPPGSSRALSARCSRCRYDRRPQPQRDARAGTRVLRAIPGRHHAAVPHGCRPARHGVHGYPHHAQRAA